MPDSENQPSASSVPDAEAGEGKKETAPESTASASPIKPKGKRKKRTAKTDSSDVGRVEVAPGRWVEYNKKGSSKFVLPQPYEKHPVEG